MKKIILELTSRQYELIKEAIDDSIHGLDDYLRAFPEDDHGQIPELENLLGLIEEMGKPQKKDS